MSRRAPLSLREHFAWTFFTSCAVMLVVLVLSWTAQLNNPTRPPACVSDWCKR